MATEFSQVGLLILYNLNQNGKLITNSIYRFCKSNDETKKTKLSQILESLISLTIEQKEMYPSIQAKIWGSIGQVS